MPSYTVFRKENDKILSKTGMVPSLIPLNKPDSSAWYIKNSYSEVCIQSCTLGGKSHFSYTVPVQNHLETKTELNRYL